MKAPKSFGLGGSNQKDQGFLDEYFSESGNTKENKSTKTTAVSDVYTRQTFMISQATLEKLKDFVHTKRKYEDYNYSQKMAIEEALELLFNSFGKAIEKRANG